MADVTTLRHVNDPVANTWNYLNINGVQLAVPTCERRADGAEPLAPSGLGADADAWIAACAPEAGDATVGVGDGSFCRIIIVRPGDQAVACNRVRVRDDAETTIIVVAGTDEEGGSAALVADTSDALAVATAGNEGAAALQKSADEAPTCASLLTIEAGKRSKVTVHQLVGFDASQRYLDGLGIVASEDAQVTIEQYVLDAGAAYLGTAVELAGERARLELNLHYLVRKGELLDVNYLVRQTAPKTSSEVHAYGVLYDGASKTLRDTIDFVKGSAGSVGHESETVLLAGERVVNKSLPTILCTEEDMEGNHGATIGAVAGDQAEYLRCRGLSDEEITALFARSVVDGALELFMDNGGQPLFGAAKRILGADAVEEYLGRSQGEREEE